METTSITRAFFTLAIAGLFGAETHADTYPFRVAFENVPGIDEIRSGDLSEAIEILKVEAKSKDPESAGYALATLCGVYVINGNLNAASETCDHAVATAPGDTAYNNRGVLRAFTGDFRGAREDFSRARPDDMQSYMEELRIRDVGLVADSNAGLLDELATRHSPKDINATTAMRGADVQRPIK